MGASEVSVLPDRKVLYPDTVFRASAPGDNPLSVQGAAGQTANLFQVQSSTGANLLTVESQGFVAALSSMYVTSASASDKVLQLRGRASQTGNLLELQNSAGVSLGGFGSSGSLWIGSNGSQMVSAITLRGHRGGATDTNSLEWGHANGAGYGSAIGYNNSNGAAWIAFHGEAATSTANAFRSRGLRTMVLQMEPTTAHGTFQFMSIPAVSGDNQTPYVSVGIASNGSLAVNGHTTPTPVDTERFVVWASSNQTQGVIQARHSNGSAIVSTFPTYTQYYGNHFIDFGPNTTWNARLRVGGNGHTIPGGNAIASVVATDGNLHLDGGTNSRSIYCNWYATGTGGVYFGNGASGQVGRIDGAGNASFVSWTSTSRMDTKTNVERVLEEGPDDETLMSLSAVRYQSALAPDPDNSPVLHSFVAEEVAEIMPEVVTRDENGEIMGINMTSMVTILMTQVQNLTARVRELEAR